MSKRVWISFPLTTSSEVSDASVVSFLKGGQKKELEVEIATFTTKWLVDKSIPFGIDFDTSTVDRNVVIAALPKRVQKILGVTVPVVTGTTDVPHIEEAATIEEVKEIETLAEVDEDAELVEGEIDEDEVSADDPSELR
jgi:NCAIR mutase (PurE)-related protein